MEIVCPCWHPDAETIESGLPILDSQGVTAIEIGFIMQPKYFDLRDLDSVNRLVQSLDMSTIRVHAVHAGFGSSLDFSSFDDQVHEHGVEAQIEAMEVAKLLGAGVVVIHASDGGINTDRQRRLDRARGVIRELAKVAEQSGLTLAIENLPPGYLGCEAEEIAWLIEQSRSEWVAACFDSGHANLTGNFLRQAEMLLPMAATTHLHDNDGLTDQHKFPGEGTINWAEFGRLYNEFGRVVPLVLECIPPDGIAWSDAFQKFRIKIGC